MGNKLRLLADSIKKVGNFDILKINEEVFVMVDENATGPYDYIEMIHANAVLACNIVEKATHASVIKADGKITELRTTKKLPEHRRVVYKAILDNIDEDFISNCVDTDSFESNGFVTVGSACNSKIEVEAVTEDGVSGLSIRLITYDGVEILHSDPYWDYAIVD